MGSIQELCSRVIVLKDGGVIFDGAPEEAIGVYNSLTSSEAESGGLNYKVLEENNNNLQVNIESIELFNPINSNSFRVEINKDFRIGCLPLRKFNDL